MRRIIVFLYFLCSTASQPLVAQVDYGTRLGLQQGTDTILNPRGSAVLINAIDPAVRRWYVPQELYAEHKWRQWESINYSRHHYQRYVSTDLEGDYFYDFFGSFLTQGWQIYNVSQASPQESGTALFKGRRFESWFSEVVIAGETKGQYSYALTVSNDLRTTLTPLTLSKPRMDGVQLDLATDKYRASMLYSQLSTPRGTADRELRRTNSTTLLGGRFTAQLGDFVELGIHSINGHQVNTQVDEVAARNLYKGSLTAVQNQTISSFEIVLRDDSPEDGIGGAAYFASGSDIIITYRDGKQDIGKNIRFTPVVQGGAPRQGFIEASGNDEIRLIYDFESVAFVNRASADRAEITNVEFRLAVANDYQIWITSDRQTTSSGDPSLLLVTQANGNVQDVSNLRIISFNGGLPTATHILGGSLKISDILGFDFYGEYDLNWNYLQYPNLLTETHATSSGIHGQRNVPAWMVNASHTGSRIFFFGEAYNIDPQYNTQSFVTSDNGSIDYTNERNRIDFVEDNDDQDRIPDSFRADWSFPDRQVFPGWDQNNDFVPDLNQNDNRVKANLIPDYEEPFLRFNVDRPEFLFGVDMNNNFWVDQYENDQAPDYPYPVDHQGFNVYGGLHATPHLKIMAGIMRESLISSKQRNNSIYAVANYARQWPRFGTLHIYDMAKRVKDNIADPLFQWQPGNTLRTGQLVQIEDPMLAQDTFVNQFFAGHSLATGGILLKTYLNYSLFKQQMSKSKRQESNLSPTDFFFGLINKASYRYKIRRLTITTRWKSEYIKQSLGLFDREKKQTNLTEQLSLLTQLDLMRNSSVQGGIEYLISNNFDHDKNDFNSITGALQFSTESAYQGYKIRALTGILIERKDFKGTSSRTETQSFIAVYAGLQ